MFMWYYIGGVFIAWYSGGCACRWFRWWGECQQDQAYQVAVWYDAEAHTTELSAIRVRCIAVLLMYCLCMRVWPIRWMATDGREIGSVRSDSIIYIIRILCIAWWEAREYRHAMRIPWPMAAHARNSMRSPSTLSLPSFLSLSLDPSASFSLALKKTN